MAGWNRSIRDEDCLNERGVRMSWYRDSSDGRAETSECKGRARIHGFTVYVYEIHEKTGQLVRV